jgi:cytochrome c oxidase subunit 5a
MKPSVSEDGANSVLQTGIKAKVESRGQYDEYLQELQPIREELGVNLKESLYPEAS